ncbi:MAG: TonB-dependent receptor [Bacteroidales bacterium]|nr:TonB-dependent receptor [Bacteroidales bacterium]
MSLSIKRVAAAFAAFLIGISAFAQVTTSSVSGTVTDETGAPLGGAVVTAAHNPTGSQYYAVVNDAGQYNITGMRAGGPYTLEVSFLGMGTVQRTGVTLKLGEPYEFDAQLASTNELDAVVVQAKSTFNASKTGAGASFSLDQIEQIPTINRSVFDVVKYTPQANNSKYGGMSIAGTSTRYNSFQVDGAVANDSFGLSSEGTNGANVGANPISYDAIEEIQVVVAPFDVRQNGFTGGAINAITKSGTNQVKGTAYAHYYNEDFIGTTPGTLDDTDPLFIKSKMKKNDDGSYSRMKYDEQYYVTYGATVGAPIIKNKLFLFASFEGLMSSSPNIYSPVNGSYETAERELSSTVLYDTKDLGTYFNTAMADAVIEHYKNVFAKGMNIDEGYAVKNSDKRNINALVRLDWNINDNHKLMFRYQLLDAKNLGNGAGNKTYYFNNSYFDRVNTTHTLVGELNSRLADNMSNDLRVTAVMVDEVRSVPYAAPTIYTNGDNTIIDIGTHYCSYINKVLTSTYTLTDNLYISLGKHNITLGTHNEFYTFANAYRTYATGQYEFKSVADFFATDGTAGNNHFSAFKYNYADPTVEGVTGPDWFAHTQALQLGLYAQDEWRPNRNFTLTYGLRADAPLLLNKPSVNQAFNDNVATYSTDTDQLVGVTPKLSVLVSPRLGFRWFLNDDHKSLVRGGIGMFTGRIPFVWLSNAYNNTGVETKSISITGANDDEKAILAALPVTTDPYNDIVLGNNFTNPVTGQKGIQGSSAGATINTLSKNFKYPQVLRVNLGFDREFENGWKVSVDGIFSKGFNNIYFRNVALVSDAKVYGASAAAAASNPASVAPYYHYKSSDFKTIVALGNTNAGYSYSASAKVEKTFDWGLYLMGSYTYGHSFTANDGLSSQAHSNLTTNPSVDTNAPEISYSLFDIPHKVAAIAAYKSPAYAGGLLATSVSLAYTGTSGQRYSFVYYDSSAGAAFNGDGYQGNSLIYIPLADEMANIKWSTPADQIAFEKLIRSDKYLSSHRGQWAERNGGISPFEHHIDLQIAEDVFYDRKGGRKMQIIMDLLNLTNLLNREWGLSYASTITRSPLNVVSLTKDAAGNMVPEFSFKKDNAIYLSDFSSRWRFQLGVKFTF